VAHTSLDSATRRREFAVANALATDAPYVPLVWLYQIEAISTCLINMKPEPVNSDLWNVYDWELRQQSSHDFTSFGEAAESSLT
jgi:hypothetical protein